MKKTILLSCIVLLVVIAYSCKKNNSTTSISTVALNLPQTPYMYYGDSNAITVMPQYYDSLKILRNKEINHLRKRCCYSYTFA